MRLQPIYATKPLENIIHNESVERRYRASIPYIRLSTLTLVITKLHENERSEEAKREDIKKLFLDMTKANAILLGRTSPCGSYTPDQGQLYQYVKHHTYTPICVGNCAIYRDVGNMRLPPNYICYNPLCSGIDANQSILDLYFNDPAYKVVRESDRIALASQCPGTPSGLGDFDGDGKIDLLIRNDWKSLAIRAEPEQLSQLFIPVIDHSRAKIELIGDFNGNGSDDILYTISPDFRINEPHRIVLLASDGKSSFQALLNESSEARFGQWLFNAVNDRIEGGGNFDGNGGDDILIRSGWGIGVLTLRGTTFDSLVLSPDNTRFGGWLFNAKDDRIEGIGDFDGDGRADILIRSGWGIAALTLSGSTFDTLAIGHNEQMLGQWRLNSSNDVIEGIGDINGNKRADIVVTSAWGLGVLKLAGTSFDTMMTEKNGMAIGHESYQWLLNTAIDRIQDQPSTAGVSLEPDGVCYRAYEVDRGWLAPTCNGGVVGSIGQKKRLEALKIWSTRPGLSVCYQVYQEKNKWLPEVCDGQIAGLENSGLDLESLKVRFESNAWGEWVKYATYIHDKGWSHVAKTGEEAGGGKRMEGFQVWVCDTTVNKIHPCYW